MAITAIMMVAAFCHAHEGSRFLLSAAAGGRPLFLQKREGRRIGAFEPEKIRAA